MNFFISLIFLDSGNLNLFVGVGEKNGGNILLSAGPSLTNIGGKITITSGQGKQQSGLINITII